MVDRVFSAHYCWRASGTLALDASIEVRQHNLCHHRSHVSSRCIHGIGDATIRGDIVLKRNAGVGTMDDSV